MSLAPSTDYVTFVHVIHASESIPLSNTTISIILQRFTGRILGGMTGTHKYGNDFVYLQ